jgi:oxygen-independent coproporphyrinogen-3 oxidase
VSNFARPGAEALHNLNTWRGQPYLGLGPSASSLVPEGGPFGTRRRNPDIKGWLAGAAPEEEHLTAGAVVLERLLTGLRTREGVDLSELQRETALHPAQVAPAWYRDGVRHGLLEEDGATLRATDVGLARLDAVLAAFVRERDR